MMKINDNTHFVLFSNCIIVEGHTKSIIMDLQRSGYLPIQNLLYEILNLDLKKKSIGEIKKHYKGKYNDGINAYFEFLAEEEYGFFTNEPEDFPSMNTIFLSPFSVVSSIINITKESNFKLEDVLIQLVELGCQLIQVRIFNRISISNLKQELECIKGSRVKIVEIYLKDFDYDKDELKILIEQELRLTIIIHSANETNLTNTIYLTQETLSLRQKEKIDSRLFVSNIPFYIESLGFNVGLNRKLSIDFDGSIKNFVNHSKIYGNVTTHMLKDIVNNKNFQKKWHIHNDIVEKCMDCEFRYMCLSNSDIVKKGSKYFKVETCDYNPYIGLWEK